MAPTEAWENTKRRARFRPSLYPAATCTAPLECGGVDLLMPIVAAPRRCTLRRDRESKDTSRSYSFHIAQLPQQRRTVTHRRETLPQ